MAAIELRRRIAALPAERRRKLIAEAPHDLRERLDAYWPFWARTEQLAPEGDWRLWLLMAGRGFGKTRTGAEWVRNTALYDQNARIALVASSIHEARSVMVEGESGILACHSSGPMPLFEPSLRRLTWETGAQAMLYSANEPESLRGPQHSHAWCDEIAKWGNAGERAMRSWTNLQMGLRLGRRPRALATTTPRAAPLVRRLLGEIGGDDAILTRGTTYENAANLPLDYVRTMHRQFGRTALGRQELDGELLTDIEGALWSRSLIERCREDCHLDGFDRVVVGVDPPASSRGDECGIIVAGIAADGRAKVMADHSIRRPSPERWAREVARAALEWNADRVVAEANQGGEMVESVLRAADCVMPIKLVHARSGKAARAEPIAALYESGRVAHLGMFGKLEDQLCGLMAGGEYEGPGRSPDRADALVYALTELMLGQRGRPAIRGL